MHTAALFGFPDPRSIAARPVDWIAAMIWEGASVPRTVTSLEGMEKVVDWMPGSVESALEISDVQPSQVMGTERVAS